MLSNRQETNQCRCVVTSSRWQTGGSHSSSPRISIFAYIRRNKWRPWDSSWIPTSQRLHPQTHTQVEDRWHDLREPEPDMASVVWWLPSSLKSPFSRRGRMHIPHVLGDKPTYLHLNCRPCSNILTSSIPSTLYCSLSHCARQGTCHEPQSSVSLGQAWISAPAQGRRQFCLPRNLEECMFVYAPHSMMMTWQPWISSEKSPDPTGLWYENSPATQSHFRLASWTWSYCRCWNSCNLPPRSSELWPKRRPTVTIPWEIYAPVVLWQH